MLCYKNLNYGSMHAYCTVGYEHRHDSKPEFQSPSPGFNPYGNANVCECAKLGAILFIIYGLSFPTSEHEHLENWVRFWGKWRGE